MTDVEIKKEKDEEHLHTNDPEQLVAVVAALKREEQLSSDEENFADDNLKSRDVKPCTSSDEDADLIKLEELIAKSKNEINTSDKNTQDTVHGSRSRSPVSSNDRKRKVRVHERSENENSDSGSKRVRQSATEPSQSKRRSPSHNEGDNNVSPTRTLQAPADTPVSTTGDSSTTQQEPSLIDNNPASISGAPDAELIIQNLLKEEDYNSDDEPSSSNQGIPSTSGPPQVYGFPNGFPMAGPIYDPAFNMMGNMPPNGYPPMYNIGLQPQFYGTNMGNMPMMGFGYPQMMNIPTDQNEVECLPVVNNTGFTGMPTFKRIKLEKKSENSEEKTESAEISAEEKRKLVFEKCIGLLEKLEFAEQTGKFTFTPTVAKLDTNGDSNSVVQKITNVSYEFHSIGPKLNVTDWGLKEIGSRNADIAKKIAISADVYFTKIKEKANTIVRKLIKVEDDKVDENKDEMKMEEEEPTLSSFLKNSMTQTDALICKECVARKRIVGHNIGVQTVVYSGTIATQTIPEADDSGRLAAGLNANQLKALYEFSSLIREPSKNTTVEMYRLRENLMDIYNLSQRSHKGPIPNASIGDYSPRSLPIPNHVSTRDPRTDARSNFDSRNVPSVPNHSPPSVIQGHGQQFNSYQQQHPMQVPNQQLPGMQRSRYQPSQMQIPMHQPPTMQVPSHQQPTTQFPRHPLPSYRSTEYPPDSMQGPRRSYGRGSQPR